MTLKLQRLSRVLVDLIRPSLFGASFRGQLLRGGTGTLALTISAKLLAFLIAIILARLLGPAGYGVYAFAVAVATVLAIPVQLGLPSLLVRMVALYEHRKEWNLLRGLLVRANQTVLIVSLFVAGVSCTILLLLPDTPDRIPNAPVMWAFALIPLMSLSALRSATLLGFRHPVLARLPEDLIRPLGLTVTVLVMAFFLSPRAHTPSAVVVANLLITGFAFLVGSWFLYVTGPKAVRTEQAAFSNRTWIRTALPFMMASTTLIVVRETDVLMLGMLAPAADVGVYRVASQGATLVVLLSTVVNAVISPHIARLFEARDHGNLRRLCRASSMIATIGAIPVLAVYLLLGESLLAAVFGAEFERGFTPLVILSCGYLIYAFMAPVGPLLSMTGHAWEATAGVALAAIVNIILNFVLIPSHGAVGAASASIVAIVLMHVFLGYFAYRRIGIFIPDIGFGGRST